MLRSATEVGRGCLEVPAAGGQRVSREAADSDWGSPFLHLSFLHLLRGRHQSALSSLPVACQSRVGDFQHRCPWHQRSATPRKQEGRGGSRTGSGSPSQIMWRAGTRTLELAAPGFPSPRASSDGRAGGGRDVKQVFRGPVRFFVRARLYMQRFFSLSSYITS